MSRHHKSDAQEAGEAFVILFKIMGAMILIPLIILFLLGKYSYLGIRKLIRKKGAFN